MLVVDASVALKWLLPEPGAAQARVFLPKWENGRLTLKHVLFAPTLILLEVHNVLAGRVSRNEIDANVLLEGVPLLRSYLSFDVVDWDLFSFARTLSIVAEKAVVKPDIPPARTTRPFNIYDCVYIALAKRNGASLLTADQRQAEVAKAFEVSTTVI